MTAAPPSCAAATTIEWREVKPYRKEAPVTVHTWLSLQHTSSRLLVKDVVVEFLSNDLKISKAFFFNYTFYVFRWIYTEDAPVTLGCFLYLWWEEPLYPAGKERFVKNAVDWGPLPGVAFKQLCQERAQFLGIMCRHRRKWTPDDLQHQILHVSSFKLRRKQFDMFVSSREATFESFVLVFLHIIQLCKAALYANELGNNLYTQYLLHA